MRRMWCVLPVVFWLTLQLSAQDLDSVPTVQRRDTVTLADQIADSAERSAFLALFKQASPAEMRNQANRFIAQFPQSAFLAQAYEVAARCSFGLEEYDAGLDYARKSLTLLPENPLLLVPVADVEARQHFNAAAIKHAQEALRDLDAFAGPASVRDEDWPLVKRRLKATANFAKGRAELQAAIKEPAGARRKDLLREAEASLVQARQLNSDDFEVAYTLGLVQLSSGNASGAAANFAAVKEAGGGLEAKADEALHSIYGLLYPTASVPYESFVLQAASRSRSLPKEASDSPQNTSHSEHPQGAYFGSESCRPCHAKIYNEWTQTGMSKMFRPYSSQNIVGDFSGDNQFYLGDEIDYRLGKLKITSGSNRKLFARMVLHGERHYFDILQSDGKWHSYPVDYTIGSKFEQAYATKLPNGEIHVFPIQYNLVNKRWVNFWRVIDGPGSERADPRNWEKLDASTSYQAVCAVCHTSQLRNVKGAGFDVKDLVFKESGIDCEMCHGPSGEHVLETSTGEYHPKAPLDPPVNFSKITSNQFAAICAQCHMQSAIREPGPNGELNYSSTGNFFVRRARGPFGEFSRKGFFKDGRFRQTTFLVESLERSQCFKKGGVNCGSCHDPHSHDAASNPTSLKFRGQPDQMCTGCHAQFQDKEALTRHSHHPAASEGSRCVSCHMPRIMHALLFDARYHQIDDIPNAELTKRFGQEDSPNACLLCHSKQDADWVQRQLTTWKSLRAGAN
jgi:predicted CXXCH cytochrome family protein